ncbi:twin-arginine translocation signal domain-containing protein [Planctomycetota bacterium]
MTTRRQFLRGSAMAVG